MTRGIRGQCPVAFFADTCPFRSLQIIYLFIEVYNPSIIEWAYILFFYYQTNGWIDEGRAVDVDCCLQFSKAFDTVFLMSELRKCELYVWMVGWIENSIVLHCYIAILSLFASHAVNTAQTFPSVLGPTSSRQIEHFKRQVLSAVFCCSRKAVKNTDIYYNTLLIILLFSM